METEGPSTSLFDDLIDRSLRGEEIDVEQVLAAHPELPDDERRQIRILCGRTAEPSHQAAPAGPPANLAPNASLPVTHVGGHRLVRRIGAGAMGAVFLAEDAALGRQVAIKILGPDILGAGERTDRFLREVRAAARVQHPNIVTVHSAGEQDGLRYMVMEYVPGSSLQEVVADATTRGSRPSVADVLRWGAEIATALRIAHEHDIVHRDVKPSNIRISQDGRAMLLDFGLARDASDAIQTETGSFRGSPQYASPEQVESGRHAIDGRSDLYSLGATLYEVLTGVAPFRGETREQLFHAILTRDPVPPRRLEPSIPRDLETVLLAALEKDPARRPQSAAALAADLEAVREGRPVSVRPPSAAGRVARWAKRHPARAGLALVLLIGLPAIAALGGFLFANLGRIKKAEQDERALALAHLLERGFLDVSEGGDAASQTVFEEAMRFGPDSGEAKAGFAIARLSQRDGIGVVAFLDGLPESDRSTVWSRRIRLEALREIKRGTEAKAIEASLEKPVTSIDHFVAGYLDLQRFHLGVEDAASSSIEHLRAAILFSPAAVSIHYFELGHALMHARRNEEARQVARAIEQLWPESPERWFAIGRTLRNADHAASASAFEKASNPPPRAPSSRDFITIALSEYGDESQKRGALERAKENVRLEPGRAFTRYALGTAQSAAHDQASAIESFREALRLAPTNSARLAFDVTTYRKIAQALQDGGDLEGAIGVYRGFVQLYPKNARFLNALGIRLLPHGDVDEAIRCFEREIEIDPNDADALCNLGRALQMRGEFRKGLDVLRKGHEIGSKRAGWDYPSATWVEEAENNVALERRFEDLRRGDDEPPTAEERVTLAASVCRPKRLYAEAARLYAEAFQADKALESERSPDHLLAAAALSLAAGLGRGEDAPAAETERRNLRARSLAWVGRELAKAEKEVGKDAMGTEPVTRRLRGWTAELSFRMLRVPAEDLAGLSAEEREAWATAWSRFDALVGRVESRSVPVTK